MIRPAGGPARAALRLAALLVLAIVVSAAAVGCSPATTRRNVWSLGLPGSSTRFLVKQATNREGYLDVWLDSEGFVLRTFTHASVPCLQMFEPEAMVDFRASGSSGVLVRGDSECQTAGIGSLRAWRSRLPRPTSPGGTPIPRAQANYRAVYRDAEVTFLRGRFPLTGKLAFSGVGDVIAVVPHEHRCDGVIARQTASMEYHPGGQYVLTLVGSDGPCPIEGLIRPIPSARGSSEAATPAVP